VAEKGFTGDKMKIQTATICKNEEDIVRPWLETLLDLPQIAKIIICDTGSTDRTIEYIKSYDDPRIDFYETPKGSLNLVSRNSLIERLNPECRLSRYFFLSG
jgi:glycosyltransferase involved in cell wall biosynthesis